jgi:ATP-binding cassette subfamily B multidrug efflux pump
MKLILKYLKPYTIAIILCLALLFGEAICDLYLPNLMSNIVNNGIQFSGVEEGAPEIISKDGLEFLEVFMTESQKADMNSHYKLIKTGSSEADKYTDKYPKASEKDFYVLDNKEDKDASYNTAYNISAYTFMLYMQDMMKNTTSSSSQSSEGDFSDFDISQMYQMTPMLSEQPAEAYDEYRAKAEANTYLSAQIGTTITRLFYKELGADMNAVQRHYIILVGLIMLGVALLGVLAAVAVGYISSKVSASVARKMRRDVFEKVNSFSSAEFDRFSTASLITRTTNDIQQVQMLIIIGIRLMCYAPILGIGGVIMALQKSVSLSWIIAVAVVFLLGLILVILAVAMPKFKALQKLIDKLNLVSRENLSGLMVIRAFRNESHEEKRFEKANTELADTTRYVQRTIAFVMPVMMFLMNGISLVIIWVGAKEISNSTLQIGDMMAFIQYTMQIIISFLMIAMMFIMIPRAAVSAVRIKEVLDSKLTVLNPETSLSVKIKGKVEYKNVSFRYSNAEEDVLQNISFTALPGQTTAFIGATGSGKSTLVNLLPRFYDVTAGSIEVDGVDIRKMKQEELRDNIGYVPQKAVLFSGTIDSNTRYGKENTNEEDVLRAIEVAQAAEFVNEKPEGVLSDIAQGGANVSGGQKQRLSIARALLKKPPIYIFDDSFSALDFKTDAALRKALKEYTADSTVLIVAQRVSTIMNADQIIVIDGGRMIGKGTHAELMQNCPEYREIAESQLSKGELE